MKLTRKMLAVLLVMALALGLAACGGTAPASSSEAAPASSSEAAPASSSEAAPASSEEAAPAEEPADTGYLQMDLLLNDTLDGYKPITVDGLGYAYQLIFGNLMYFDSEKQEYVPGLAEKLDISDDNLVYTVTLRDGLTFHDGMPLTADDVVFTYNNVLSGAGSRVSKLSALKGYDDVYGKEIADAQCEGIKKIDDKTVSFTLSAPNRLFIVALAESTMGILPKHCFEGMTPTQIEEDIEYWAKPIGSGPYMFDEVSYPNYVTLKAFDGYYVKPGVDKILMTYYADSAAQQAAMIAGTLDVLTRVEEEFATNVSSQNPDCVAHVEPGNYIRFFQVNASGKIRTGTGHPGMTDKRVRQALNLLTDKEAMCQLNGSLCAPLSSIVNPESPYYDTNIPAFKRDVEKAKQLLDEANFDYSIPIRVYSHYTNQTTADLFELLAQNWGEVGIKIETVQDSNWENYQSTKPGEAPNYDLKYGGWAGIMDPIEFFVQYSYSGMSASFQGESPYEDPEWVEYHKARYDELVAKSLASQDPAEQQEILNELQENYLDDLLSIPLYCRNDTNIFNEAHIKGFPSFSGDIEEVVDLKVADWSLVG